MGHHLRPHNRPQARRGLHPASKTRNYQTLSYHVTMPLQAEDDEHSCQTFSQSQQINSCQPEEYCRIIHWCKLPLYTSENR